MITTNENIALDAHKKMVRRDFFRRKNRRISRDQTLLDSKAGVSNLGQNFVPERLRFGRANHAGRVSRNEAGRVSGKSSLCAEARQNS